jgi:uncharacterized protein (DUF302 family)
MSDTQAPDIVEHRTTLPFDLAVERLSETIARGGLTVFARIDHAANARAVGMTMLPATVLIYGNAKGGTPIMLAAPSAALDLPLRVLVREREDGQVVIAYHPIAGTLRRAGVAEDFVTQLDPAQQILLSAIS